MVVPIKHQFLKDLFWASLLPVIGPMAINILCGYREELIPLSVTVVIAVWMIIYPYSETKHVLCAQSLRTAILLGAFTGIYFSLAGRVGLALNYIILSSDRKVGVLFRIFIDSWQIYLWIGLFGIITLSIKPLLRNIIHRDSS